MGADKPRKRPSQIKPAAAAKPEATGPAAAKKAMTANEAEAIYKRLVKQHSQGEMNWKLFVAVQSGIESEIKKTEAADIDATELHKQLDTLRLVQNKYVQDMEAANAKGSPGLSGGTPTDEPSSGSAGAVTMKKGGVTWVVPRDLASQFTVNRIKCESGASRKRCQVVFTASGGLTDTIYVQAFDADEVSLDDSILVVTPKDGQKTRERVSFPVDTRRAVFHRG